MNNAGFEQRQSHSVGIKCALGNELEPELAKYRQIMDEFFFGHRRRDILLLAYQLAMKNNTQHPFSQCNGMAGKKWPKDFIRHPQLAFKTPQFISLARVKGFT